MCPTQKDGSACLNNSKIVHSQMNKRLLFTCLLGYFGKTSSSEQSKQVLCQKHEDFFPNPNMNMPEKVLDAQFVLEKLLSDK